MRRLPPGSLAENTDGPAVCQTANCAKCGEVLAFGTNGMGRVLEVCPHCDEGRPLRVRPLAIRRCGSCTKPLDELEADTCRRCIPRLQVFLKCIDCGGNARQTRCAECRRSYQLGIQRERTRLGRRAS